MSAAKNDYIVDEARYRSVGLTGIYVRARDAEGAYGSFDIAHLALPSLMTWLRSRDGENPWAESVVATLLGHDARDIKTALDAVTTIVVLGEEEPS